MRHPLLALALAFMLATPVRAAPDISALFGSRVKLNPHFAAPVATGDFDGDGQPDAAYLVSIAPASPQATLARDVTVLDHLFDAEDGALGARGETTALAIVQQGGKRKFLLTSSSTAGSGQGYFDTPIWGAKPVPLTLAPKGSKAFRTFHKQAPRIRSDILVLGTEAGIDTALYWNGKTYVLFTPNEEP